MLSEYWLFLFCIQLTAALLCFNCTSTHRDWTQCGGDFVTTTMPFNNSAKSLINCTGENAMCFVRSWSARSRHAWIVQRGCYQTTADDSLPRSMNTPTRAMSCKLERYPEAEYKVCFCQANWCNPASTVVPTIIEYLTQLPRYIMRNIITLNF